MIFPAQPSWEVADEGAGYRVSMRPSGVVHAGRGPVAALPTTKVRRADRERSRVSQVEPPAPVRTPGVAAPCRRGMSRPAERAMIRVFRLPHFVASLGPICEHWTTSIGFHRSCR